MALIEQEHLKVTLLTIITFLLGIHCGWHLTHSTPFSSSLLYPLICLLLIYPLPYVLAVLHLTTPYLSPLPSLYALTVTTFSFGIIDFLCLMHPSLFSCYLIIKTIYHYGEFQLINTYHHQQLSWSSYLIYHSFEYTVASAVSLAEHVIWAYAFGCDFKKWHALVIPGMLLMLVGLLMRLMAFYTAKANFTHLVQYEKKPSHVLVTDGIYKYLRHPGYTGFYYFSIGSMMFIGNPICFFAYAVVLYSFFKQRIAVQQYYLQHFFNNYEQYRKTTPTLIPFIP